MMNFAGVGLMLGYDEFCMQNDGFCMKNDEFCMQNDGFCMKNDELPGRLL